jgi:O-antigen/teichoic acid export membrane protein
MSRLQRVIKGVASSYLLLVATALYSLASVPIALHYLDKSRFGLWVLMGTVANFLNLIDVGMTGASARLLIDHKDDRDGGRYGGMICTGWLVCFIQGGMVFIFGLLSAGFIGKVMLIPVELQEEFIRLMHWQCGTLGLMFSARMFSLILSAHQRMDLVNYLGAIALLINFLAQWIFFHCGVGVLSLSFGVLAGGLVWIPIQAFACISLKLFPRTGHWGGVSWQIFHQLFSYGRDLFLVSVGTQLIMASQGILITRVLGLDAAALWGVGTRVYNLLNQVIWKVSDMSGSVFAEIMSRGESALLKKRYRTLAVTTFSLAGWAAVSLAACNSLFVGLWTHQKISWPASNDILLALWMIISAVVHTHNSFILLTKKIGFMRYVYLMEGITFVLLCLVTVPIGGIHAVIFSSIICSSLFSGLYGVWRVSNYFVIPMREVAVRWSIPMCRMMLYYVPAAALVWFACREMSMTERLSTGLITSCLGGGMILFFFGLEPSLREEVLERLPTPWNKLAIFKKNMLK